jgi:hypothetical protein
MKLVRGVGSTVGCGSVTQLISATNASWSRIPIAWSSLSARMRSSRSGGDSSGGYSARPAFMLLLVRSRLRSGRARELRLQRKPESQSSSPPAARSIADCNAWGRPRCCSDPLVSGRTSRGAILKPRGVIAAPIAEALRLGSVVHPVPLLGGDTAQCDTVAGSIPARLIRFWPGRECRRRPPHNGAPSSPGARPPSRTRRPGSSP